MDSASLPLAWYTGPDAFSHERRTLFAHEWQMIGRADQLAESGAYVCANLAGWSVFVMRGAAGALGAFRNVCRHQNLPVLENGAGTSKLLRCRYHGWTYDFTGAFVSAPPMVAPPDPKSADQHLSCIGVAEWRGLVFINPDPAASSPAGALDALVPHKRALLAQWRFHGEIATDFNCNWKILADRYASAGDPWYVPGLAIEADGLGAIIHQIVPRTHLRSRVVRHLYFPHGADPGAIEAAAARAGQAAAQSKDEADAAQASCAAGHLPPGPPPGPALAAFRARLRAIHAQASSGSG
jgi:phenylpropionate dioxygenase-like ring-hydroxylating dioxygenase large terminal subunit